MLNRECQYPSSLWEEGQLLIRLRWSLLIDSCSKRQSRVHIIGPIFLARQKKDRNLKDGQVQYFDEYCWNSKVPPLHRIISYM